MRKLTAKKMHRATSIPNEQLITMWCSWCHKLPEHVGSHLLYYIHLLSLQVFLLISERQTMSEYKEILYQASLLKLGNKIW